MQHLIQLWILGETALHLACLKNHSELMYNLINAGTNPNLLTNELRQSALHYAVKSDAEDCIRAFIDSNEDIEKRGMFFFLVIPMHLIMFDFFQVIV